MIKGSVTNPTAVVKYINNLKDDKLKIARKAVIDGVLAIHREAVTNIAKNSDGTPAVRYRNGRPRDVTVSNPFDYPNTDTGRLVQSIKFDFDSTGSSGRVGSNLPYAKYLELGTKDMAPRPWLTLAIDAVQDKIKSIFIQYFEKGVK
jgi:HK97 gp10 family phage protein